MFKDFDEFAWSSDNFRFQAFEAASVSNLLKVQFPICQQKKSYYGDVTTTG
ncbi:hypothetical protein OH690_09795 [Escherichia coli]|nr:hypothetical protein [Escherichia coli]